MSRFHPTHQVFSFRLQVGNGRTQTEVELILCNYFEVLFLLAIWLLPNSHVLGFRIGGSQIDVVRIIFQTSCPYFSILTRCIQAVVTVDNLIISAVRFSIGCTYTESFILISSGETETITVSFSYVSAVILP